MAHPDEIPAVWKGGMSFHGGLAGAALGIYLFALRYRVPLLSVFDIGCAVVPIGLFLGRIANFIKPELWGRPTDVPWAIVFPEAGPLPAIRASFTKRGSRDWSCSYCWRSRSASAR